MVHSQNLYKQIRSTTLQQMLLPGIVFALVLSAFFFLNVPALFYAKDVPFFLSFIRAVIFILLLAAFADLLFKVIVLLFPRVSRAVRTLSGYGKAEEIMADAEAAFLGPHLLEQDNVVLTEKYLFKFAGTNSAIVPLTSVLWVFGLNNMRYSFTEKRERMVYFLRVVTISGKVYKFASLYKKNIDKITDTLSERYPNFFYGYSDEHDKMVRYILSENKRERKEGK